MSQCDILIIGAGPGGYVAAEEAARLGKKVTVIEKKSIGGTCLNVGCIPSKAYLEHAHWLLAAKEASQYGVTVLNDNLDFQKLVARKDQVVATLQSGIQSSFKQLGITYIEGEAAYISDKTFQVNGERVSGKSVILATGSHPFIPPIPGINDVNYLTTDSFFNLKELPQRLVIIGGGIISVELAFAMAPLGVDVTVIEVAPTILATEDDEARSIIREKMEQLGITILEGVSIDRVKENAVILADGKSYSYDNLLVATGRKPNIELAQMMGLELTEKGFIKVDSYYESSQSGVYAIGDLIPGYMLAHVASSEGIKAVRAICRQAEEPVDNSSVPRSLFTTPEIASFGLSEEEAVQQGYDISVSQLPYVYNGRAIASNSAKGFVKIVSEKRYHLLLGAVIVGPHATDILQSLIVLKDAEGTLDQLDKTIFAHPTISELVQEVARLILRS